MIIEAESACESFQNIRLRAMNTQIEVIVWTSAAEASGVKKIAADWFGQTENRFSRFREDSELSRLNQLAGERCIVSDAMLEVLLLTETYRKATGGVFDPFVKRALEDAGYTRSFEQLQRGSEETIAHTVRSAPVMQPLIIDPAMKSVVLPGQMDLGGIVKSWSVRRLAHYFQHKLGIRQGLINAGGDLAAWSSSAEIMEPWLIGIENPWEETSDIGTISLHQGAVATSSKLGRKWTTDRGEQHHLIDPRTMKPSSSDIVQCTVTGPNAVECEIWAKTLCILGLEQGLALLSRKTARYEALLFTSERRTQFYGSKSSLGTRWREIHIDKYHLSD